MTKLKYGFNFNDKKLSPMKGLYTIFDESVSRILSDLKQNYITKDAARYYKFSKLHIEEDNLRHLYFMSLLVENTDDSYGHQKFADEYSILHTRQKDGQILAMDAQHRSETPVDYSDKTMLESENCLVNHGVNVKYTDNINFAPFDINYVSKQKAFDKQKQNWLNELNKRYQKELNKF